MAVSNSSAVLDHSDHPGIVAEPSPELVELRADIAQCEARIERLGKTWHLHNSYADRNNALADLDTLTHYVARRREDLAEMEQAELEEAARVDQLAAMAAATGSPVGVALAHLVAGPAHEAASYVRTAVAGMSSTAAPAAAITPAVERLLGKFASWLDKPWRIATQINTDNLLAVLRIHARFMHGCRALSNEATASRLQRDYGSRANWGRLHADYLYAEAAAELAWTEAMADAERAFAVLTGMNPKAAPLGRLVESAELLNVARRSTVEVAA